MVVLKPLVIIFGILLLCVITYGGYHYAHKNKSDSDIPKTLEKKAFNFIHPGITPPTIHDSIKHVFIILEENHDWASIYNNPQAPFINTTLLKEGAYASNYRNIPQNMGDLHPSELNYILLESGRVTFQDHTFTTDNDPSAQNSTSSTQHLVTLLDKNGYTWKSYQEGITGNDCPIQSSGDYAPKHNPMLYFQNVSGNPPSTTNRYCQEHIRPLSELADDIKNGTLPNYVFITPNLQHDMHNGTMAQADTWLSQQVPTITKSDQFKKDGALFITWDEGSEEQDDTKERNDPIGLIMLSPFVKKNYTNTISYSHASLLKTVEEIFQLKPYLGLANDPATKDLQDFFLTK